MSEDTVMLTWMLVTLIGAFTIAVLIGEGIASLIRWYCRHRGWLPEREIVVRMPLNSRVTKIGETGFKVEADYGE